MVRELLIRKESLAQHLKSVEAEWDWITSSYGSDADFTTTTGLRCSFLATVCTQLLVRNVSFSIQ